MTLQELIARFRQDTDDATQPYLFNAEVVLQWLNEAVVEACIRARLIHESDDADVCQIAVVAGTAVYQLHAALYELTHAAFRESVDVARKPLKLVSTGWLDANVSCWRDLEGEPKYAIQTDKSLRLVPRPDIAGQVLLEGYRTPLTPMAANDEVPPINASHHLHLLQWPLYCAYARPDVDFYDKDEAEKAEAAFTRYFGARPDVDLRRATRTDEPQHVEPFWP